MLPKRLAVVLGAVAALVLAVPAGARATSWTEIPSGTTSEISAVEYQDATHFWFATKSGEVFTRQADGSFARTLGPTAVPFNDIEFNGSTGFVVGNAGQVFRSTTGGATWTNVNPGGTPIPVSKKAASSTFNDCTGSDPLGDVNAVRFAGPSRVWIFAEGSQVARSTDADLGGVGAWQDANRTAGGDCKLDITYNQGGGDAFFVPSNPDVGYVCTAFFGEVFFTADGLADAAAKKTGDCGNGTLFDRRLAGDPGNPNRMWAVGPGGGNASYLRTTTDGWTSSSALTIANADRRDLGNPYDVDFAGGTVLVAGDTGMVLMSNDGTGFFYVDAGGPLATEGWRAASLASATAGAIGGTGGHLAVTADANAAPDIVAPTGSIGAPDTGVAGRPVTFTAQVADQAGGSGVNAASLGWSTPGLTGQTGPAATFTFPAAGFYTVTLTFADNAGNQASTTKSISIAAPSATRPRPTLGSATTPPLVGKAARRVGKFVVFKVKGRLGRPAGVTRAAGCRGRVNLSVYKGKKRLTTSRTTVTKSCAYTKTVKVRRTKVGRAKRLKLKVAFKGNAALAALSSTYTVKVKK